MNIERLQSDEFVYKLREKIIPIEKEKNPDKYLKYDYTSIDKKIKRFLDNLPNLSYFFVKFDFLELSEDDIIRLAELFICRPDHLKGIYKEIRDVCNSVYDFKGLIYSESGYEKNEDIYADYKSLVFNSQSLDECVCISDYEKNRIWKARWLFLEIINITREYNIFNENVRLVAINQIKYINTLFFDEIKVYQDEEKDQYDLCKELSIELYMDFVETIVRVSLMYYVPAYVRSGGEMPSERNLHDAYNFVINKLNCIENNINLILQDSIKISKDGSKSINKELCQENITITFEDQIKRFVYYIERCSKYNEASLTMDSLQKETDDDSQKFDYNASLERIIRRFKNKPFSLEQLQRYRDKDGKRKVNYTSKEDPEIIKSLADAKKFKYTADDTTQKGRVFKLLVNAENNNNTELLYCSQRTVVYRELYVRKNPSILLKESATKIINDLSIESYDWESYYRFLTGKSDNITNYDIFRAKRKCRRQLNFLDQKFIRGFFYDNNMVEEYNDYIEITRKIHAILLNSYLFFDYNLIFSVLCCIADCFLDVLLFAPNQKAPEPITIMKIDDSINSFIVTHKQVKKKRGRPRSISEDDDKRIESLIESNPFLTVKGIMDMLSLDVSEESVRQHIKKMGFQYDRKTGYSKKSD